jgi:hypothetical protein
MNTRNLVSLIVLAVVGVALTLWSMGAKNGAGVGIAATAPAEVASLSDTRKGNQEQEALAVAKSMYLDLQERGARARANLDELRQLHTQWTTEIAALPGSEEGRLIASDKESAEAFHAHFTNVKPMPDGELDSMVTRLSSLLSPVDAALQSGAVGGVPRPELAHGLAELEADIQEWSKPYAASISSIQSIAKAAKARGARGDQSLQSELERIENDAAVRRAEYIQKARAKAEEEVTQKLAKAEQDLVLAQGEKKLQEKEAEAKELRAKAEADALKARATNSDTLKRLKPFTSKSTAAFTSPGYDRYQWKPDQMEAAPHSFSALSRYGALEQTDMGIKRLHHVVMDKQSQRPAWVAAKTPEDWAWIKENQALLRELGPTLVELGYLAP